MKRAFIIFALLLSACDPPRAIKQIDSANPAVHVELLTSFDGVRLYRIDVGARTVYVAVQDGRSEVSWEQSCGKNCVEHMSMQTVQR